MTETADFADVYLIATRDRNRKIRAAAAALTIPSPLIDEAMVERIAAEAKAARNHQARGRGRR